MTTEMLAMTEQDEIRLEIDESRAALVEKLGLLEEKVAETVQNATSSVAEATASVVDTVNSATASVSETVETVNAAVQGTVQTVTNTVSGTVDSVRDTFDLPAQVQKHPWPMFAGAVVAGYVGANYFDAGSTPKSELRMWSRDPNVESFTSPSQFIAEQPSAPVHQSRSLATTNQPGSKGSNFFQDHFGTELAKLKGLAIGVSLGMIRDMISESAPESLKPQIAEIIDGFTTKMGGEHIQGPVLSKT